PRDRGHHEREEANARTPRQRDLVAGLLEKPRTRDRVDGRVLPQDLDQLIELVDVVLAIAIDLDGELVAVLEGVAVAGLHGSTDAEVEREPQDGRARSGGALPGLVRRAVIDHDDVEPG